MDPENQEVKEVTEQEAKEKEKEVEVEDEGASDSGEEEEEEGEGGPSAAAFDLPPEGQEPNPEADLVASKLLGFLIKAFIDKVLWRICPMPINPYTDI